MSSCRCPQDIGGPGGPGTNPEQLFAVGYGACFQSALLSVAQGRKLDASDSQITARVGIGPTGHGGFGTEVTLDLRAPRLSFAEAAGLMARADNLCPYSNGHPRQRPGHPQRRRDAHRAGRGTVGGGARLMVAILLISSRRLANRVGAVTTIHHEYDRQSSTRGVAGSAQRV